MSSISSGTTTTTALVYTADTTGNLVLQTNGTTTALTLDTSQNATFAGKVTSAGALTLASNGSTTAVTIDTNQNVNIGNTGINSNFRLNLTSPSGNGGIVFVPASDGSVVPVLRMLNAAISTNVAEIGTASGTSLYFSTGGTERARIDNSGVLAVGTSTTSSATRLVVQGSGTGSSTLASFKDSSANTLMSLAENGNLLVGTTNNGYSYKVVFNGTVGNVNSGNGNRSFVSSQVSNENFNTANSAVYVGKDGGTSRSINAGGTVNASGADYAEYMVKAGNFTINKGDICGIDVNGKLTNVFANAISFVVKSTNPSYVGGDTWGSTEVLGLTKPTAPTRGENESDADWATAETNYQTALTAYEAQLATANENARQMVDRIAFSGQVPVNVTGATAGQYIVPVANQDGSIGGEAVSESAITLQQYMQSVGKVISVANNVTTIIVKVA